MPEPGSIWQHKTRPTRIRVIGNVIGEMIQVLVLDGVCKDEFHNVLPMQFGAMWLPVEGANA